MKKVAVLFSGGLDSTFLVYKNLKEGNKVQPIYISVDNNVNKSIIEKHMIIKNYLLFKKEFKDLILEPQIILKLTLFPSWDSPLRFKQVPIWLFAIQYLDSFDEFQMGYISNDDAIPYLGDMKRQYKSLDYLFHTNHKRAKLTFPLVKYKKEDIIEELPKEYFSNVFSCENPNLSDEKQEIKFPDELFYISDTFKRNFTDELKVQDYTICGECDPCKKILQNNFLLNRYSNVNSDYKKIKTKSVIYEYEEFKRERNYDNNVDLAFIEIEERNKLAPYSSVALIEKEEINKESIEFE